MATDTVTEDHHSLTTGHPMLTEDHPMLTEDHPILIPDPLSLRTDHHLLTTEDQDKETEDHLMKRTEEENLIPMKARGQEALGDSHMSPDQKMMDMYPETDKDSATTLETEGPKEAEVLEQEDPGMRRDLHTDPTDLKELPSTPTTLRTEDHMLTEIWTQRESTEMTSHSGHSMQTRKVDSPENKDPTTTMGKSSEGEEESASEEV